MSQSTVLIDSLGGRAGITGAVHGLYERLLDDDQVASYFDDVNLSNLRPHMADFLVAALTGASEGYRGRPLDIAHRGLAITDTAFDRVVAHLRSVLADAGVDQAVIDRVAERVDPLRASVVTT